jgi:hypothetical protein
MIPHTHPTPAYAWRQPAAHALQRDIDHELGLIRGLEKAMERMAAGKRLDQAEAQWNRLLDRLTALHEEQERMSL